MDTRALGDALIILKLQGGLSVILVESRYINKKYSRAWLYFSGTYKKGMDFLERNANSQPESSDNSISGSMVNSINLYQM